VIVEPFSCAVRRLCTRTFAPKLRASVWKHLAVPGSRQLAKGMATLVKSLYELAVRLSALDQHCLDS
jgi:hypothetical protein